MVQEIDELTVKIENLKKEQQRKALEREIVQAHYLEVMAATSKPELPATNSAETFGDSWLSCGRASAIALGYFHFKWPVRSTRG